MSAGQSFAENTDLLHKIKDEDNIIRNMKPSSLFFIWFAANLTIGDFAVGFIPVSLGTPVSYAIAAIITGKHYWRCSPGNYEHGRGKDGKASDGA
jgi:hypothetical protein